MSKSLESEWAQHGTMFSTSSRSDKIKLLPCGVYQYIPTLGGFLLDRTHHTFEFPFKVYNAGQEIIDRIITFWVQNGGNLGILMNGLRGAGKTMTAQLLANKVISELNIPVLVVKAPIPLQDVFDAVKQDMMVIFDEFEKTHKKEEQQKLLSVIDGMSRSAYNRLVVFTTNSAAIDENFKDRPSRIHYQFEFQRVADEIIDGLISDGLPAELQCYRNEIFDFLQSRFICTIDIVKAVIAEVRTFKESPTEFEHILNISKGEPPSYTVSLIDVETNRPANIVSHFFKPHSAYVSLLSGNKRAIKNFTDNGKPMDIHYRDTSGGNTIIRLVKKCEEENCWLAEVGIPKSRTFYDKFSECYENGTTFFLDNKPDDWKFTFTRDSVDKDEEKSEKLQELYEKSEETGTLYGTGKKAVFKIHIEPNREAPVKWSVTGKVSNEQWDELASEDKPEPETARMPARSGIYSDDAEDDAE